MRGTPLDAGTAPDKAPATAPGDGPAPWELRAAPLRDAPTWERALRIAVAVVLSLLTLYGFVQYYRAPPLVNGGQAYAPLLNDVAKGLVTTIDDSGERFVLWRVRGGDVFAERVSGRSSDLRSRVAARTYGRPAPRYERIDVPAPRRGRSLTVPGAVLSLGGIVVVLGLIRSGPQPRAATRWGWIWLAGIPFGVPAYLLLAGSRLRTADDDSPRVSGRSAFRLAVVGFVAWIAFGQFFPATRPGEQVRAGQAPAAVARLTRVDHRA